MSKDVKQAPSTEAALKRDPKDDLVHFLRSDPDFSVWKQDHKQMRSLSPVEVDLHRDSRKWRPSHNKDGVGVVVHSDKREKATEAFMYSPPAILEPHERALVTPSMVALEPTPELPIEEDNLSGYGKVWWLPKPIEVVCEFLFGWMFR